MHGKSGNQNRQRPNQDPRGQGKAGYQEALEVNRRRAGIAAAAHQSQRVDVFAEDEPQNRASTIATFMKAGLLLQLASVTLKTKFILLLSVVGMILYVMADLSLSTSSSVTDPDGDESPVIGSTRSSPRSATKAFTPPAGEVCDESEVMRTMGTQWLAATEYANGITMSVKNKSQQIAFMDLQNPMNNQRATTAVVMPGGEIRFPLAGVGVTGSISSGTKWCNRKIGWQDGKVVPIRPAVMSTNDSQGIKAYLYDRGNGILGMKVFNERPGRPAPIEFN